MKNNSKSSKCWMVESEKKRFNTKKKNKKSKFFLKKKLFDIVIKSNMEGQSSLSLTPYLTRI